MNLHIVNVSLKHIITQTFVTQSIENCSGSFANGTLYLIGNK